MKHWLTQKDTAIYQILPGRANAYLIQGKSHWYLADTGPESSYDTLVNNLGQLQLKVNDIGFLLLTHTHYDHCQSAAALKEQSGCKVVLSEEALPNTEAGFASLPKGTSFISKQVVRMGGWLKKERFSYQPFQADIILSDQVEPVMPDAGIKIIRTPGHSSDSMSIVVDDEIAVVGDAMFGIFKKSILPPFADDTEQMIRSWRKLLETGCHTFLPGHGKEISRNFLQQQTEKYSSKFLKNVS